MDIEERAAIIRKRYNEVDMIISNISAENRDKQYHIVLSILRSKKYYDTLKNKLRDVSLASNVFTKKQCKSIEIAFPKRVIERDVIMSYVKVNVIKAIV